MSKSKTISKIGLMIALAFILSYLESLIPISVGIPGVKLGLSNLVVMVSLYQLTAVESFGIALVRILLTGITFGNMYSLLYSLAGGLLSFVVMLLLKKSHLFDVSGVSLAGGVSHNIGQILVACVILQTKSLIFYLPVLLVAGVAAGLGIGVLSAIMIKRLNQWSKEE